MQTRSSTGKARVWELIGAIVGGVIFSVLGGVGITDINLYSLIVAVVGSVVVLWVYNAVRGRRAM